jgi:uncharacterized protein (DUF433 family)/DNA-binding transcriptional MerR regulator
VSYSPELAAALSGASVRQLSYWRSSKSEEGPLLKPEFHKPRSRVSYSFQDVVALRTFIYLRVHDVSLQRVRKAVKALRKMGETQHLSRYRLVAVGRDVVWKISGEEAVALAGEPGQQVIAEMVDVLAAFAGAHGRTVVPLLQPQHGVRVDPEVRGGYPVIDGTRVPYDLVAGLLMDGMEPREVAAFYPSVAPSAAAGALAFAEYVGAHNGAEAA